MKIKFTLRNEEGLHCRFCDTRYNGTTYGELWETSPIKGIVCKDCKYHLENYVSNSLFETKEKVK